MNSLGKCTKSKRMCIAFPRLLDERGRAKDFTA